MELHLIFLGVLGLLMGFVGSVSGGSGVFGVPTMLALGLPPINVLALNRLSDIGVVSGAFRNYHGADTVNWRLACMAAVPMAIGSFVGARLVSSLSDAMVRSLVLMGVAVGIFLLVRGTREVATGG